jgi:hypothetical protein
MYAADRKTIHDRREMLRVKLKSLAAEARIIRREEARTRGAIQSELRWHRTQDVRCEARLSCIAYGLIRGKSTDRLEPRVRPGNELSESHWKAIGAMLKKFGPIGMAVPEHGDRRITQEATAKTATA